MTEIFSTIFHEYTKRILYETPSKVTEHIVPTSSGKTNNISCIHFSFSSIMIKNVPKQCLQYEGAIAVWVFINTINIFS